MRSILCSIRRTDSRRTSDRQTAALPLATTACSTGGRRAARRLEDLSVLVCIGRCGMDRRSCGGTRPHSRWKWRSMQRFAISASWRWIRTGLPRRQSEQNYAGWKKGTRQSASGASQPSISGPDRHCARSGGEPTISGAVTANVQVEMIARADFERPSGRRFGALVHAILASIDLSAGADPIQMSACLNGRLVGATEDEIRAAIVTVSGALEASDPAKGGFSARTGRAPS